MNIEISSACVKKNGLSNFYTHFEIKVWISIPYFGKIVEVSSSVFNQNISTKEVDYQGQKYLESEFGDLIEKVTREIEEQAKTSARDIIEKLKQALAELQEF